MDGTVLNALVELVKQGGSLALWGIFLWQALPILKVTVMFLFVWLSVKEVAKCLSKNG